MIKMTQKARKAAEKLALWYGAYQRDYLGSSKKLGELSANELHRIRCAAMMLREAQDETGIEMVDIHSLLTVDRLASAQLQRLAAAATETETA